MNMVTRRDLLAGMGVVAAGSLAVREARAAAWQPKRFADCTLNVLSTSGHRQYNPVWDLLPEFQRQTGIQVVLTRVPVGDIRQKIMQDLAMNADQFDVLEVLDDTISSASRYMTSMEPFINRDFGSVVAWSQDTAPWALRAASVAGPVKYYPFYSGTVCGVLRDALFTDSKNQAAFKARFGYDLPVPPKTWKELQDAAQFFTREENGKQLWGVVFPGQKDPGQNVFDYFMFNEGVTYLDEKNHCNWGPKHPENQPIVAKVASFLQDLIYKQKVAPPTVPGMATNETVELYLNGGAAMVVDNLYFAWDELNSQKVIDRIGKSTSFEAPASSGDGKGGIPFYWMWGICERSKAKEQAWEFLRWFMQDENLQLTLTKGIGVYVPTDRRIGAWAAQHDLLPPAIIPAVAHAQFYHLNPQIGQMRYLLQAWSEKLSLNALTPAQFVQGSGDAVEKAMVDSGLAA